MRAIIREIRRLGYDRIVFMHGSISEYVISEWGLGRIQAERIEEWFWGID